jgi:ABC-type bacteriocin/lantibiotic exporter with double-glycine peptidase domain
MIKEDNVVIALQKAIKHLKIKVTGTTVNEFLLAHPHYPSLRSVCDALTKWKVEKYPLNLELEELKALEMPFIAHLKAGGGQLVFVEEIINGQVVYYLSGNKKIKR